MSFFKSLLDRIKVNSPVNRPEIADNRVAQTATPIVHQSSTLFKELQRAQRALENKPAYRNLEPAENANAWSVLEEIRVDRYVWNIEGQKKETAEFVTLEEGKELHRIVTALKPRLAIEVGLMHGYSSLCILQALAEIGNGRLISIDPGQFTDYACGIGLMNIRRANLHPFHLFWDGPSQFALPALCKEGAAIEFAFLDGNHLFDYTLLEFFYVDKLLSPGGVIAFHDYVNPSVFTALQYIESNFPYAVEPCHSENLRILRKLENDARPWYYFVPFRGANISWITLENRKPVSPGDYPKAQT